MERVLTVPAILLGPFLFWGCTASGSRDTATPHVAAGVTPSNSGTETPSADVISVDVTGAFGSDRFSAGILSPDEGCEQYADWGEVLMEDGGLLYRRLLAHSHVDEQPFVRSGGPVSIDSDTVVWVWAHMHPAGYGGTAFRGSAQVGFQELEPDEGFADGVEHLHPLAGGCSF